MSKDAKVFGVALEQLLEHDKKKHPELKVPYIAHQALNLIIRDGIESEGIFRISGNKEKVALLREQFDKGEEIDFVKEKTNPNDVCSLFKMYLRELPDPLLTYDRFDRWIDAHDTEDAAEQRKLIKELIHSLPHANRVFLAILIPSLARVAMNQSINKMDSGNLSKTVGPNLLWKDSKGDSVEYLVKAGKVNHIVQLMIDEYEYYFPHSEEATKHYATLHAKMFGHKKSIQCMIKGVDENEMWSCDSQGTIRIWNIDTSTSSKEIETDQGRIFTMSKIGKNVWTASQKCAKIWSSDTKECIKVLNLFAYCMVEVGDTIWLGGEEKITIFNSEFTPVKELAYPGIVITMCVDSSGKNVWTGGSDKSIRIWSTDKFEMVKQIKEGHTRRVNSIIANGNQMWSAGDDNAMVVWDADKMESVKHIDAHSGAVYNLSLCGSYVWSCSWDTSVHVWNTKNFTKVFTLPHFHSDAITSVITLWNKSKKAWQAWTSSWDKSVAIWKIGNKLLDGEKEEEKGRKEDEEEENAKTIDQKLEELNKKTATLKEKNTELMNRAKELKEKKAALSERRDKLAKRKADLDEKKKELQKRKEELNSLQAEIDSSAV